MIWDPDGPARKPPPESVDMLHAINERFHLSQQYQRCTDPDFLLMSIGQSNRDAIERAYDWLIPIVSSLPTVISRLPSSASCLLLLRAYSTSGEEKKQLKELLAPLLQHVTDSLRGLYGESDAVKAFDLIMSDMASKKAEKRKCARKVLQDLLFTSETLALTQSINLFDCMIRILELKHANLLVRDAINHMVSTNMHSTRHIADIKVSPYLSSFMRQFWKKAQSCQPLSCRFRSILILQRLTKLRYNINSLYC